MTSWTGVLQQFSNKNLNKCCIILYISRNNFGAGGCNLAELCHVMRHEVGVTGFNVDTNFAEPGLLKCRQQKTFKIRCHLHNFIFRSRISSERRYQLQSLLRSMKKINLGPLTTEFT